MSKEQDKVPLPSSRTATYILLGFVFVAVVSVGGLFVVPESQETLRSIMLFLAYGFGLPVVVWTLIEVLQKIDPRNR